MDNIFDEMFPKPPLLLCASPLLLSHPPFCCAYTLPRFLEKNVSEVCPRGCAMLSAIRSATLALRLLRSSFESHRVGRSWPSLRRWTSGRTPCCCPRRAGKAPTRTIARRLTRESRQTRWVKARRIPERSRASKKQRGATSDGSRTQAGVSEGQSATSRSSTKQFNARENNMGGTAR